MFVLSEFSFDSGRKKRGRLFTIACFVLLGSAVTAHADVGDSDTDEDEVVEEILVTGYHVKRTGIEGPARVVVFDQDSLETSGINTLGEFAQFLPYNAQSFSDAGRIISTTAETSNFNLRGIGNDSTLTLNDRAWHGI